jgi:hypothetical protein
MAVAVCVAAIAAVSVGASVAAIAVSVGAIAVFVAAMAVCVAAIAVCVGGGRVGVGVIAMAVCVAAMAVCVAAGGVGVSVDPANASHTAKETLLVSNVTAPFRANTLPDMLTPVFTVILASARIFPLKVVVVPSVAELPTCQNTLQGEALLIRTTDDADAVVSVLPILKTQTALGSPWALSVSAPVNPTDELKQ